MGLITLGISTVDVWSLSRGCPPSLALFLPKPWTKLERTWGRVFVPEWTSWGYEKLGMVGSTGFMDCSWGGLSQEDVKIPRVSKGTFLLLGRKLSLVTGHGYPHNPLVIKILIVAFPCSKELIDNGAICCSSVGSPYIYQGCSLRGCLPPLVPSIHLRLGFTKKVSERKHCRGLDLASCAQFICVDYILNKANNLL